MHVTEFLLLTRTPCSSQWHPINHQPQYYGPQFWHKLTGEKINHFEITTYAATLQFPGTTNL